MWNTRINDKNEDITSSARIKFNEADRKIAFELFCLLDTAKTITGRTFHKSFVYSQRSNCTTDIKDKRVEDCMKEVNTDAAASIMSTLRQCYDENRSTVTQVIVTEESNARGDAVEVVEEIEVEAEDLDVTPENIDEDALRDDVYRLMKLMKRLTK
jgi:hypothetical protein